MTYSAKRGAKKGKPLSEAHKQALRKPKKKGYVMTDEHCLHISLSLSGHAYYPRSEEMNQQIAEVHKKNYIITFPDGHEEQIHGLNGFCRLHNLSASSMLSVARGNTRQHKGFKCRRV